MKVLQLCEYLDRLDKTSSRNEMGQILAELIKNAKKNEARELMYLLLGRVKPLFEPVEFGVADKQVMKAMVRAAGVEEKEVSISYKSLGDLGLVWSKVSKRHAESDMEVLDLYKSLSQIASESGGGSQERKLQLIEDLLVELSANEGKYVIRILLGKLRLGFSDKTLIEALSVAEVGDKGVAAKLEYAYQVRPDIGWLVARVKEEGWKEACEGVGVALGTPMMVMLAARLKTASEMIKKMGEVAVEPKFDGTRIQIHFQRSGEWKVKTYTRNLEENTYSFPELLKLEGVVDAMSLVLDAEAVGINPKTGKLVPFQMTITRKRKHSVGSQAEKVPVVFYVFDVMYKNGVSLIGKSYLERREILRKTVKKNDWLRVDEYETVDDAAGIVKLHKKQIDKGLEGVIVKKLESKYVPGRTGWRWVKMKEIEGSEGKLSDTIDAVVMGFYSGKGKRAGFGIGKFLVGVRSGERIVTLTKIGTGLSDEQFRQLKSRLDELVTVDPDKSYVIDKTLIPDVWVEPKLVVEVAADEITNSPTYSAGVSLRFPRLVKFRDDKSVQQATTIDEVKQLI